MRTVIPSTAPGRRVALLAGVVALLAAAGCSHKDATAIGAPLAPAIGASSPAAPPSTASGVVVHTTTTGAAPARPATGAPPARPATGARSGTAGPATGPTPLTAPTSYRAAVTGIPQLHIGYADLRISTPAGWPVRATVPPPDRQLYGNATGTYDRRDPSGKLLVRIMHEPSRQATDDLALAADIDRYRQLPGATVRVTAPAHNDNGRLGILRAEWTVDVPVDGQPRHALVSGWVLDDQVITVYVSVPAGAEPIGRALYAHATDLHITLHPEPEAG